MTSDRALLKYNKEFVKIFSVAFDRKRILQLNKREIEGKNIVELCDAIDLMHMKELKFGGRNVWYITGQLLAGTILFHQRQVELVHEETRLLQQSCLSRRVILQKTQTIKRRTRVIQTKDKRKQTVDEEITTNVFVWNTNEYQQMDENDNRLLSQLEQPDPCMRTLDEITLHDVDENENGFVEREHNVFSQINDFGEPYIEPENVLNSPNEENLSVSDMFGSFIEPGNGQQAIEPNDVDQMNTNGANAIDGQNIDNDISCESLPPSPIRNVVYRDQVKKRKIEVTPKKKPVVLPSVRGNNHTPPKVVNGALSVSQVDNGIPATPLHNRRALSWQDNLDDSELTDDNNNSPIADNNRMPTQPEPNDDIIPETPISVHNTPVQPVDDVPIVSLTADENVIPAPNEEDANLSPPVNLEPLDDINPQTPVNNIQVQPDDDVPMTPINSIPNADEIVVPSPVKSEPIDIEPPVIPPKRKRRSAPKKKKKTLCVDDVIMLDVAEMRARIENLTVDCKQPQADIISKTDILLRKEATFFTVPTIDGEVNRELFKRNLVQTDAENDLSIIDAILGIPENGQSELDDNNNSGRESQVIQGDQLRRRSSRKRKSPDVEPRVQHEPIEMPIPEQTAHPTPVEPMDGIESQLLPNLSGMHISLPDEQSVEQPVRPKRSPSPADDTLNENDKMVMRKLRALWKRNDHPVTMTSITERKSSRLQAAKNFASILILKKLRLVEVEADERGQIQHIAKVNAHASRNI